MCVCVYLSQSTSIRGVGDWEMLGKNRHPTSMLNLETVWCLAVVCPCETGSGAIK